MFAEDSSARGGPEQGCDGSAPVSSDCIDESVSVL